MGVALKKIPEVDPIFAHGLYELPEMLNDIKNVQAVVTDFRLEGHTGDDVVKFLRRQGVDIPVFLLSGSPEAPAESSLYWRLYSKPFTIYGWVDTVRKIVDILEEAKA